MSASSGGRPLGADGGFARAPFYGDILALRVLYALRDLALTPAQLGAVLAVSMVGPGLAAVVAGPVRGRFGGCWAPVAATAMFAPGLLFPLAGGLTWSYWCYGSCSPAWSEHRRRWRRGRLYRIGPAGRGPQLSREGSDD